MTDTASFYEDLHYEDGKKPAVKTMIKNDVAKEIRILFRDKQEMKEHAAPFPIIVHIMEGLIDFGVNGKRHLLKKGMMIQLPARVPHNLIALQESMVRLSVLL